MAENRHLKIILDLQDKASKELTGLQGKLQTLEPAFKKMAVIGTAAFVAIGAGIGVTIKSAAQAEGSWNKFNTVFGEGAEDMTNFIKDIRKEMPTATHEIARMAADLQDLLVPMGLARGEAQNLTKGFLDVANKVAAFNDVDPTQVLEAFKSGLAGSSEPLRQFGINALESSIELEAVNSGLLKTGQTLKDLDPITRSQVKAQALLTLSVKQSADAISGFAINNDSFIRRSQNVKATMEELSVTFGKMFLPIIDNVTKRLLPLLQNFQKWAEKNEELSRVIITLTLAVSGTIAVVGILGLALPAIIRGFSLMNQSATLLTAKLPILNTQLLTIGKTSQMISTAGGIGILIIALTTVIALIDRSMQKFKKAMDTLENVQKEAGDRNLDLIKSRNKQVQHAEESNNAVLLEMAKANQAKAIAIINGATQEQLQAINDRVNNAREALASDSDSQKQWAEIVTKSSEKAKESLEIVAPALQEMSLATKDLAEEQNLLAEGVKNVNNTYKEFSQASSDALFELGQRQTKVLEEFENKLDSIRQSMSNLNNEFAAKRGQDRSSLSSQIVLAQDEVAALEKKLSETSNQGMRIDIQSEIDQRRAVLDENAAMISTMEEEIVEVRRRASLSDLERAIEDFRIKRSMAEQEFNSKMSELRDEMKETKKQREEEKLLYAKKVEFIIAKQAEMTALHQLTSTSNLLITQKAIDAEIEMYKKLAAAMDAVRGSNTLSQVNRSIGSITPVNDAIISPTGDIITTHPKDYLIATKNPSELGGGSGMNIIINGGIFGSDAPEELANLIMEKLNLVAQI